MEQDFTVKLIGLTTVPLVSTTGQFVSVKRATIMVGPFGPFSKDFPPGADSPEIINQWKVTTQAETRAVHQDV